jgi:hypothetical protein
MSAARAADRQRAEDVHGGADFVVHLEHEFRLAVIQVRVDLRSLDPAAHTSLVTRLAELRASGYHVSCSPAVVGHGYAQQREPARR